MLIMTFSNLNSIFVSLLFFAVSTTPLACGGSEGEGDENSGGTSSGGSATSGGASSGGSAAGGGASSGGAGTGASSASGGMVGTGGDTSGAIFGDPCTDDSTCPMLGEFTGYCRDIWPDGYCSVSCSFPRECGAGNVCDVGLGTCLKACGDDGDCREGYKCSEDWGGCEPM